MEQVACKSAAEVSCLLANLLAELEQPCRMCKPDGAVVLTGTSPTGEQTTVRLLPGLLLEVEGGEALLAQIRGRRCPHEL